VYVFVNLEVKDCPEYRVVPSNHVATNVEKYAPKGGSVWYTFSKANHPSDSKESAVFGNAHVGEDVTDDVRRIKLQKLKSLCYGAASRRTFEMRKGTPYGDYVLQRFREARGDVCARAVEEGARETLKNKPAPGARIG
jgi:hypothetical protein